MKTDDIEYNTLKRVCKKLKGLCKDGMPGENGDALGFFIEATIEDGLLAVKKMVKQRKRELKPAAAPDTGTHPDAEFAHIVIEAKPAPAPAAKRPRKPKQDNGGF